MNDIEDTKNATPIKRVYLCGVQGCCPSIEFQEKGILIQDDFGGQVHLTPEQWADLVKRIKQEELAA